MKKLLLIPVLALFTCVNMWGATITVGTSGDYNNLPAAVAAANANDEVQLLENVTLSAQLDITKAMTLNLNGHDITLSNVMIKACQYGNLTISGTGTIHRNGTSSGTYALRADSVTLTIESATVEGGYFSLGLFNGSHGIVGADATIQTISGSYGAVYINHAGTSLTNNGTIISTVNQGTINSGSKSTGTITNNGTITATSTTSNTAPVRVYGTLTNSGTITSATTLQPAVLLLGSNAAFNMTGGSISGVKCVLGLTATNNTLNISGGEIRATGSDGQGIHTDAGTNSTINITGGSIYGGPYGPYTGLEVGANMADPIRIHGNCTLTIDGEDALIQGNNFRSVAIVNINGSEKTTVYLKNGTLKGGLFNSGLMMDEKNLTTVYMTGGQILNIEREDERKDNFTYLPGVCHFEMSGGYIEGAAGIGIKSGTFIMTGGTIKALDAPQIINAWNGGMWSAGGALQIESNKNYSGNVNITISGGELISEQGGCAIYEFVEDANDPTVVSSLSVTGGRFQGGVNLSQSLTAKGGFISGGKWSKDITAHVVAGKAANPIDENPYFFEVGDPTTATAEVENAAGQTAILVSADATTSEISAAESVSDKETSVTSTATNSVVVSENTDVVVAGTQDVVEVKKITVEEGNTLTVKEGATLSVGVGAVLLDPDATTPSLIVEKGATLVVDGLVYGATEDNFVVETSEEKPATVLFSPETEFIKEDHPMASITMISKAYKRGENDYVWQRFGLPGYMAGIKRSDMGYDHTTYPTSVKKVVNQSWANMEADDEFVPFQCYALTTNNPAAGAIYTFTCPLMGNGNAELELTNNWNYYANSYTAPISISEMISDFAANYSSVSATVYLYNPEDDWWFEINNATPYLHPTWPTTIAPMQAFIFQRMSSGANPIINYTDQIWNPIMNPSSPAPARSKVAPFGTALIEITAADGTKDNVSLVEGKQFSDAFDNAYDATKYMNDESFNLFADANNEKMSIIASDNLEGTTISMTTKKQTSFVLTISNVNGMEYAIRDNLTGTETEMVEGATYMFSVPANANVDGRFQIVAKAKIPTAIENIVETAAVKGIYTVSGQFVGNDYHNLPAGVYVVDGKKIVK